MSQIQISEHAREQMIERGVMEEEVISTVRNGAVSPAKYGRKSHRANFAYNKVWRGRFYRTKQVRTIVAEEKNELVVVTVISYYF